MASMKDIRSIVDAIGREVICSALGCGPTAVVNVVARKSFPASWYKAIQKLAQEAGIDVPDHLFNFKQPKTPPTPAAFASGGASGAVRGAG